MKSRTNITVQAIATTVQAANQALPLLPPKAQMYTTIGITVLQAIVAILSHFSNPDGTPVAVAYVPAVKQ